MSNPFTDLANAACDVVRKFNPNHGQDGRFSSGPAGAVLSPDRGGSRGGVANRAVVDIRSGKGVYKTRSGEELRPAKYNKATGRWHLEGGKRAPDHIQNLRLSPKISKVRVNLNPKGDLMAHWVADNGKVQSKYSANHDMRAAADKFGRTSELRKKRAQIFSEIEKDFKSSDAKKRDLAIALNLVMKTGMRPGSNEELSAQYKSYGATTLEGRHVKTGKDGSVSVQYVPGKKKGKEITTPILDKTLAKMLVEAANRSGPNGRLFSVDNNELRDYSKSKDGGGFKTKDHRTAIATEAAISEMKSMPLPKTDKQYKKQVKQVSTTVSKILGNTPAMAFKAYIDPQVWTAWSK